MATYFHGNPIEIQADGLQTLILMNHPSAYVNYSEPDQQNHNHRQQHHHHHHKQESGSYLFLNPAGAGYSLAPPPQSVQTHHEIPSLYGDFIPQSWNSTDASLMGRSVQAPQAQQSLSLSLSSQPGFGFIKTNKHELPTPTPPQLSPGKGGEEMRMSGGSLSSASGFSNGVLGIQTVLSSSKYFKAAQQVLDEVVNVANGIEHGASKKNNGHGKEIIELSVSGEGFPGGETIGKHVVELSTSEKHDVQMKKAKLVSMLDEVEQRYRHYHHQMQIVISSFEQAAGIGSAKTYTGLALQTISKQFRCLKDAILGQIRAASKALGEEDSTVGKTSGSSSRLKYVDRQIRQQRALQQLGMIQHTAWRPQRGLPERSVSVLRAWLFEHFLHPYPKDSDKHILAKQTGLTRSQVSNWFINARVRLWKPMVEEMYLEEVKLHEQNIPEGNTTNKSVPKTSPVLDLDHDHDQSIKSKQENPQINQNISTISTSASATATSPLGFGFIGSSELDGIADLSPKRQRNTEMLHYITNMQSMNMDMKPSETNSDHLSIKFDIERHDRNGYSSMGGPANFIGAFGSYPIGDIERYETEHYQPAFSGNAVSLTLGLPDNENLSLSGTNQSFFTDQNIQLRRREGLDQRNKFGNIIDMPSPSHSHSTPAYESTNIQNRKRFAAQLLPDFVA